jgi:hypothetical protein
VTTETGLAFTARPSADEVLVAHLPAGAVLTVHYPTGAVRELTVDHLPDDPLIVAMPGDVEGLGWGAYVVYYRDPHTIRNGHHRLDRTVWHQAERVVRQGGIAYIQYEQHDHHGRPRWTAVGVRREADR